MTSLFLCVAAFTFSFFAGRRSLLAGLCTVLTVGYFYGILRANLPETYSHFIFDSAVIGLYVTQLTKRGPREAVRRSQDLRLWVAVLMGWPFLLFFIPVQDYAVQLVGLRGNIFLLPFMLLGARLSDEDVRKLALAFAALNLIAFGFAAAEYVLGVERFFPRNQVTELIYKSVADENYLNPDRSQALRIPSTFTGAHAYAGAMVLTFAYMLGAWVRGGLSRPQRNLLSAAMVASVMGVFMAAARTPVLVLAILLLTAFLSGRLKAHAWVLFCAMAVGIGWTVSSEARLQRFMSLKDTEYVSERVHWSVNENIFELLAEYPMGNGLGGGGTSMPYFLQGRLIPPMYFFENEYVRIVLEQGVFGLCLWLAFIVWAFTRVSRARPDGWLLGRRLVRVACASFFATGMIGVGLLTSIPGTMLLLLSVGWIAVRRPSRVPETETAVAARQPGEYARPELAGHYAS